MLRRTAVTISSLLLAGSAAAAPAQAQTAPAPHPLRVSVAPDAHADALAVGACVLLNEADTLVGVAEAHPGGDIVRVRESLGAGRALVATSSDEELVVREDLACLDRDKWKPFSSHLPACSKVPSCDPTTSDVAIILHH